MSEEATYNPDNPTGIYDPSQYSTAIQQHGIDIFGSGAAHGKAFKQSTDDIKNAGLRTGVTKDYYGNALPATAYEYVMQQLDAARKRGNVTTNTLRAIESGAKAYYTVDKGWDISGSMSADFNMANAINKMGSGTRQAGAGGSTNTTINTTTNTNTNTNTANTTTNTNTNTNTSGATGGGGAGGVASKPAQQPTTTTPTNTPKEGWDYWINKATQAAKDYPYGVISWLQKHGSEYPAGLISVIQKLGKSDSTVVKGNDNYLKDQAGLSQVAKQGGMTDDQIVQASGGRVVPQSLRPTEVQKNRDALNKGTTGTVGDQKRQQAIAKGQRAQQTTQQPKGGTQNTPQAQQKVQQPTSKKEQLKESLTYVRSTFKNIKRNPQNNAILTNTITPAQKTAAKILWTAAGGTDNLIKAGLTQDEAAMVQFIATSVR